ncbi:ATP-dependent DNA helicase [Trichonephila clavata]|uniref:ATP-dependent DNA helicase n=1 Tax=Trichonephila clavata TaxID=2740835 RepID=A0A8X6GZP6_TRICU|nr:ATP-dependent DNA helicase [Trichonephila clavata]
MFVGWTSPPAVILHGEGSYTGLVPSQPHFGPFQPKVVLHVPVLSLGYILEKTLLNKSGQFANKLIQIGDGRVPEDPSTGLIIMPCGQIVNSPNELLSKVYPNIPQNFNDQDWLSHRAILVSRNDVVEKLNVTIQKQLPGQKYAYKSIDCILNDSEEVQYHIEFLTSIQIPDLQAHNLILKVGAQIMLIRNIDAPRLCNDTRLIVKKLMQHVIQATVLTRCAKVACTPKGKMRCTGRITVPC